MLHQYFYIKYYTEKQFKVQIFYGRQGVWVYRGIKRHGSFCWQGPKFSATYIRDCQRKELPKLPGNTARTFFFLRQSTWTVVSGRVQRRDTYTLMVYNKICHGVFVCFCRINFHSCSRAKGGSCYTLNVHKANCKPLLVVLQYVLW